MNVLICITTCERIDLIKKFIWAYIVFCNKNEGFDFLLALDGKDEGYLEFCNNYKIPLIYSEEREGVGISKNRVLRLFPEYDYYFFVDDDVELLNPEIFNLFIKISIESGFHHLTANVPREIVGQINVGKNKLIFANYGGAYFNFYSRIGLEKVGGWHTCFSKYRRYGHTEHSYRYYFANLTPAPFVVVESANDMLILHDPPHVVNPIAEVDPVSQLIEEELQLMDAKNTYTPIETISDFYYNGYKTSDILLSEELIKTNKKYPLVKGTERRKALSEHYFYRISKTKKIGRKFFYLFLSLLNNPFNNPLKHFIKSKLLFVWKKSPWFR